MIWQWIVRGLNLHVESLLEFWMLPFRKLLHPKSTFPERSMLLLREKVRLHRINLIELNGAYATSHVEETSASFFFGYRKQQWTHQFHDFDFMKTRPTTFRKPFNWHFLPFFSLLFNLGLCQLWTIAVEHFSNASYYKDCHTNWKWAQQWYSIKFSPSWMFTFYPFRGTLRSLLNTI